MASSRDDTINPQWVPQAKRSLSFVRPFRSRVAFVLGLLLFVAALGAIEPVLYTYIFDRLWSRDLIHEALLGIGALLLLGVIREGTSGFSNWLSWKVRLDVKSTILEEVVGKIHSLPLSFHNGETSGGMMTKLEQGVNGLIDALAEVAFNLIPGVAYLLFALAIMFRLDWRLSLLVILFAPIPFLIGMWAAEEQTAREKDLLTRWKVTYSRLYEVLSGIRTVKSFAMEEIEKERFVGEVKGTHRIVLKGVGTDTGIGSAKNLAVLVSRIASLGLGAYLVSRQEITAGVVLAFLGYQGGVFAPIHGLTGVYQTIRKASVSLDVIYSILDEKSETTEEPSFDPAQRLKGEVQFENVTFAYRIGRRVLESISFRVDPGEVVAIVGPSGGGKTTLMSLLLRFYSPSEGSILIDGVDLRTIRPDALRRQIGIVLQDGLIFNDSVRNNICYGKPSATEEEIEQAARAAHAHDFIRLLPKGYDTVLGECGKYLSGGEKQRISIAQALLKDPPILILDEATSSLDAESEVLVQSALCHLIEGRTTFIITHRLSSVALADRVLVLKDGTIIEDDTHRSLMESRGYYCSLVGLQARGLRLEKDEQTGASV
jgi:ATP-binding cassette, subfamily B, bacterial